ncbi:MAG: CAP domain-containing protein [Methanobrevibacter sp.]|nr:CAP domain-containing protein [Methanobrevibacter sp.]
MNFYINFKIVKTLLLILFIAITSTLFVDDVYADECGEVLKLVNKERAANSLPPLKLDKELSSAAEIRCEEIKTVFSHTRPDGSRGIHISPKANGENLAAGQKSPKNVVSAWMESPGHRKNILNPSFTVIGLSHKTTNSDYKNYWVQLFGSVKEKKISPEKVKNLNAEKKKTQITLKWKKLSSSKVTGYEIFSYNDKTKKSKLLKTITRFDAIGLTINGLQSSTKYHYRVRTYMEINKKIYYGSFSAISVKTK